eukprot:135660-Rhodomonas_salina.1
MPAFGYSAPALLHHSNTTCSAIASLVLLLALVCGARYKPGVRLYQVSASAVVVATEGDVARKLLETAGMLLRSPYAMSGTGLGLPYACPVLSLGVWYAMCGTEAGFGVPGVGLEPEKAPKQTMCLYY